MAMHVQEDRAALPGGAPRHLPGRDPAALPTLVVGACPRPASCMRARPPPRSADTRSGPLARVTRCLLPLLVHCVSVISLRAPRALPARQSSGSLLVA